jgi:hypothetical protein
MASRWVDSGINWINTEGFRTSWVIDELYLAFKEKEALFQYHRDPVLSFAMPTWDIRHSLRDQGKVFEMINTLHEWLRSDYANWDAIMIGGGTHQWIGWFDNTTSFVGDALDTALPYGGVPCWNSDIGGALEVETGVDLGFIRIPESNYRITSELLEDIYQILIKLTNLFCVGWVQKGGFTRSYVYDVNPTKYVIGANTETWFGDDGSSLATAETNYINDTSSTSIDNTVDFYVENFFVDDRTSKGVGQTNLDIISGTTGSNPKGVSDSSGNTITLGQAAGNCISTYHNVTFSEFSTRTYDTLFTTGNNGTDIEVFNETHPIAITGYDPGARTSLQSSLTVYIDTGLSAVSKYHN